LHNLAIAGSKGLRWSDQHKQAHENNFFHQFLPLLQPVVSSKSK
jgi:hypothetical protein